MSLFDRRHRWGPVLREGSYIIRTCKACGRIDRAETLVADALLDSMLRSLSQSNPYRIPFP